MKNITVKVHNKQQTVQQAQIITQDGRPTVIQAQKGVNYELVNQATGVAPHHIVTKRQGKDLHISFEENGQDADLIIKDFYEYKDSGLIGLAENGEYYSYIPDTGNVQNYVTQLQVGEIEGQALGGEGFPAPWWVAGAAKMSVWPWLVGAGGIALIVDDEVDPATVNTNTNINLIDGSNDNKVNSEDITTDGGIKGTAKGAAGGTATLIDPTTGEVIIGKDGKPITAKIDENGSFVIPVDQLPDDKQNGADLTIKVTDPTGKSTTTDINVDVVPPNPSISTNGSDNIVNAAEAAQDGGIKGSSPDAAGGTATLIDRTTKEPIVGKDGKPITVKIGDDGSFVLPLDQLPDSLKNGSELAVKVTDPAGNSATIDINVDVVPPNPSISTNGSDNIVNAAEAAQDGGIKGSSPDAAGGTATLIDRTTKEPIVGKDGKPITVKIGDDGSFVLPLDQLPDSLKNGSELAVKVTDPAGNSADNVPVTVDIVAPTASLTAGGTDGVVNAAEATQDGGIRGTATDAAGGTATLIDPTTETVIIGKDGNPITVTIGTDGTFVIPVDQLPDDKKNGAELAVKVTDPAGNSDDNNNVPVTVDIVAPTASLTAGGTDGVVNAAEATQDGGIKGTATDAAGGTATLIDRTTGEAVIGKDGNPITVTIGTDGTFVLPLDQLPDSLKNGSELAVKVTDPAGNSDDNNNVPVIVDVVAPTPVFTGDTADNLVTSTDPNITGQASNTNGGTAALVDAKGNPVTDASGKPITATVNADGTFTIPTDGVADGSYSVVVTDPAGNQSTALPVRIYKDATKPLIAFTDDKSLDGVLNAAEVGTDRATDITVYIPKQAQANDVLTIKVNGEDKSVTLSAADIAKGSVVVSATNIVGGILTATAQLTRSGNAQSETASESITVDTTAPSAPTVSIPEAANGVNEKELADGVQTVVTIPTDAKEGDTLTIVVTDSSNNEVGLPITQKLTATDIANGTVTVTIPSSKFSPDATYNVEATITDTAGNVSSEAITPVTVDTTAPSAPILTAEDDGDVKVDMPTDAQNGDTVEVSVLEPGKTDPTTVTLTKDDTVWISDNPDVVPSTTTNTTTIPENKVEDASKVKAVSKDPAGNESAPVEETAKAPVDETAPSAPILTAEDDGDVKVDMPTDAQNGDTVEVSVLEPGKTDPTTVTLTKDDTVWISDNPDVVPSTTTNTTTIPENKVEDGSKVKAVSKDPVGNQSAPVEETAKAPADVTPPSAPTVTIPEATDSVNKEELADGVQTVVGLPTDAQAGDTVTVNTYDSTGAVIGTAVTHVLTPTDIANKSVELTVPKENFATDGNYTVKAKITDASNNVGPEAEAPVVIDTTAPDAPTPVFAVGSDTGTYSDDELTNDTTPTFQIDTPTDGSTPILVIDGVEVPATVVNTGNGKTTLTPDTALPEGNHEVAIKLVDTAGNKGEAGTALPFVIDTTAPKTPDVAAQDNGDVTITMPNDAKAGDTVVVSVYQTGSNSPTPVTLTKQEDGSWKSTNATLVPGVAANGTTTTIPAARVADGTQVSAVARDAAGNISGTDIDTVRLAAPTITFVDNTNPADTYLNSNEVGTDGKTTIRVSIPEGVANGDVMVINVGGVESTKTISTTDINNGYVTFTNQPATGTLAQGALDVTAKVQNRSLTGSNSITVDTLIAAPTAVTVPEATDGINGNELADGVQVNVALPTDVKAGDTVTVLVFNSSGVQVGTVEYEIQPSDLQNNTATVTVPATSFATSGNYTVRSQIKDPAGNVSELTTADTISVYPNTLTKPSAPDMTDDTDTGTSNTDDKTNVQSPSFTVTTPTDGSSPVLVIDGVPVAVPEEATVTVNPNGTTTFELSKILGAGEHTVATYNKDSSGNQSPTSDPLTITVVVDTPDKAATPDLTASTDTGLSDTDNITKDDTPSFTVATPTDGSTPTLYIDGVPVAATVVDNGDGTTTLTPTQPLAEGERTVQIANENDVGSVGELSDPLTITVDTTEPEKPTLTNGSQDGIYGNVATDTADNGIKGKAEDAPNGKAYLLDANGDPVLDSSGQPISADIAADGTFTLPTDGVADGNYNVKVVDVAGNESPLAPVTVDLNTPTDAPVITFAENTNSDSYLNKAEVAQGEAGKTTVEISIPTGTSKDDTMVITVGADTPINHVITQAEIDAGKIVIEVPESSALTDGTLTVTANVQDQQGSVSPTGTNSITVDTNADAPTSVTIPEGSDGVNAAELADGVQVVVAIPTDAKAGDIVTVTATDSANPANTTTQTYPLTETDIRNHSATITVPKTAFANDGTYDVKATITDTAGNTSSEANTTVVIDQTAPTLTSPVVVTDNVGKDQTDVLTTPTEIANNSVTNDTTPTVVVPADDAAKGTPELVIDGQVVPSTSSIDPVTGNTLLTPVTPLANGRTYTAGYQVTDTAGNTAQSDMTTFTIDTTPLIAPDVVAENNGDVTVTLPADATAGDTVTIEYTDQTYNTPQTITLTKQADGTWQGPTSIVTISGNTVHMDKLIVADGTAVTATAKDQAGNESSDNDTTKADYVPTFTEISSVLVADNNNVNKVESETASVPVVVRVAEGTGETVTAVSVDVAGTSYPATKQPNGTWVANVPGSVLAAATSVTATADYTDALTGAAQTTAPFVGNYTVDTNITAPQLLAIDDSNVAANAGTAVGDVLVKLPTDAQTGDRVELVIPQESSATSTSTVTLTKQADGTWTSNSSDVQILDNNTGIIKANVVEDYVENHREVTAVSKDNAGNVSDTVTAQAATSPITAIVDITAISRDTGTSATDFITNVATQTVSGTVSEALNGTEKVQISTDGTNWVDATTQPTASNLTWSAPLTLTNGVQNVMARIVNASNQASTIDVQQMELDTSIVAPTVSLQSDTVPTDATAATATGGTNTDNITSDGTLAINIPEGAISSVVATKADGSTIVIPVTAGQYVLPEGTYTSVKVNATDTAGNVGTGEMTNVTVDKSAPTVSFESPNSDGWGETDGSVKLDLDPAAKTGDTVVLSIPKNNGTNYQVTLTKQANGSWLSSDASNTVINGNTVTIPAGHITDYTSNTNGGREVTATAYDKAGNQSATQTIKAHATPVTATINTISISNDTGVAGDLITSDANQAINVTTSGSLAVGEKVQIKVGDGTWQDATLSNGVWTLPGQTLVAATTPVDARIVNTDALSSVAGASITGSSSAEKEVDVKLVTGTQQTIALTTATDDTYLTADEISSNGAVVNTVTSDAGNTTVVTYTGANGQVVQKTITNDGTAKDVTLTQADIAKLGQGKVTVTAETTDTAGNKTTVDSDNLPNDFTIDTSSPTVRVQYGDTLRESFDSTLNLTAGTSGGFDVKLPSYITNPTVDDFTLYENNNGDLGLAAQDAIKFTSVTKSAQSAAEPGYTVWHVTYDALKSGTYQASGVEDVVLQNSDADATKDVYFSFSEPVNFTKDDIKLDGVSNPDAFTDLVKVSDTLYKTGFKYNSVPAGMHTIAVNNGTVQDTAGNSNNETTGYQGLENDRIQLMVYDNSPRVIKDVQILDNYNEGNTNTSSTNAYGIPASVNGNTVYTDNVTGLRTNDNTPTVRVVLDQQTIFDQQVQIVRQVKDASGNWINDTSATPLTATYAGQTADGFIYTATDTLPTADTNGTEYQYVATVTGTGQNASKTADVTYDNIADLSLDNVTVTREGNNLVFRKAADPNAEAGVVFADKNRNGVYDAGVDDMAVVNADGSWTLSLSGGANGGTYTDNWETYISATDFDNYDEGNPNPGVGVDEGLSFRFVDKAGNRSNSDEMYVFDDNDYRPDLNAYDRYDRPEDATLTSLAAGKFYDTDNTISFNEDGSVEYDEFVTNYGTFWDYNLPATNDGLGTRASTSLYNVDGTVNENLEASNGANQVLNIIGNVGATDLTRANRFDTFTGSGDDIVNIDRSVIGLGNGDLKANTGFFLGSGDDKITVNNGLGGNMANFTNRSPDRTIINAGSGNDTVVVKAESLGEADSNTYIIDGAEIVLGKGNDNFSLDNGSSVDLSLYADEAYKPSHLTGGLSIAEAWNKNTVGDADDGDDDVNINRIWQEQNAANTYIFLGGGNDTLNTKEMVAKYGGKIWVYGGLGNDTIEVAEEVRAVNPAAEVHIDTGEGEDTLSFGKLNSGYAGSNEEGDIFIETGAGKDKINIKSATGTYNGNLFINTGAEGQNDDDSIIVEEDWSAPNTTINMYGGNDTFSVRNIYDNASNFTLNMGDGDDTFTAAYIDDSVDGLRINMGAGSDTATIQHFDTSRSGLQIVDMGTGNDTLVVNEVTGSNGHRLRGGEGDDRLYIGGAETRDVQMGYATAGGSDGQGNIFGFEHITLGGTASQSLKGLNYNNLVDQGLKEIFITASGGAQHYANIGTWDAQGNLDDNGGGTGVSGKWEKVLTNQAFTGEEYGYDGTVLMDVYQFSGNSEYKIYVETSIGIY